MNRPSCQSEPLSICLTDSPRVVDLKREFYRLDEAEEQVKRAAQFGRPIPNAPDLELLRGRKAEIAREIFQAK